MSENPPAFPCHFHPDSHAGQGLGGMSLRDWFAGQVAGGMSAHSGTQGACFGPGDIATRSYEVADAMIAARSAS